MIVFVPARLGPRTASAVVTATAPLIVRARTAIVGTSRAALSAVGWTQFFPAQLAVAVLVERFQAFDSPGDFGGRKLAVAVCVQGEDDGIS